MRSPQITKLSLALVFTLFTFLPDPNLAAAPGQERWHFHTGGTIYGTPAIGTNGVVYMGSADGNLYALDGGSGRLLWSFSAGDQVTAAPSIAEDGTVYVAPMNGLVAALDPANGHVKWRVGYFGPILSCPAISPDGTLYFTPFNTRVALSGATGATRWLIYDPISAGKGLAIGADGTLFLSNRSPDGVYAVDSRTGTIRWFFRTGDAVYDSPAIDADGTVYLGSWDGSVYALDPATGLCKWRFATGQLIDSSLVLGGGGLLYVGSNNGKAYALSRATGQKAWEFLAGGPVAGSPTVGADGTVYVGADDQNLYALDGRTGQKKWEFPTDGGFWSLGPAIAPDGTLYIGTRSGTLYAVETESVGGLADSPWPKPHHDARNTGQAPIPTGPPRVATLFDSRVLLSGAATNLWIQVSANPPATVQWFKDGQLLRGTTNIFLTFSNFVWYIPNVDGAYVQSVAPADAGTYNAVVSNALGVVTTEPVVLGVNNVVASNYLGLILSAPPGTALQIESADSARGPWADLASLTLPASPYVFVDTNRATAGQRFYRTTSADRLGARLCRGWTFTAPAASRYRIDYVEAQLGYTNWQFLTNLTLPQSPYLFVDTTTTNRQPRFYRTTPLP